jgi:hypothetical protein
MLQAASFYNFILTFLSFKQLERDAVDAGGGLFF